MNDDAYNSGSIAYLNEKGFGFIQSDALDKNSYFHARKVKGKIFADLKVGDEVKFKIGSNDKGIELYDVTCI